MVDADKPGTEIIDRVTKDSAQGPQLIQRSFVCTVAEVVKAFGTNSKIVTSEDIIPRKIYQDAVSAYFNKWMPDTLRTRGREIQDALDQSTFGQEGLVASTKEIFLKVRPEFQGQFDKMGVLQEVIALAMAGASSETDGDVIQLKKNVISICDFIREALAKSRAATAKQSTTQAIKRIIHDFNRLNKDNVPITALQRMFRRLEREVAPIGTDGEPCLRLITGYLTELETLRTAGQDRVVKDAWTEWKRRIDRIKTNPLTAPHFAQKPGPS